MPHPIYGKPHHELSTVQFTLTLPRPVNGYHTRLEAQGRAETSRGSLWHVSETWTEHEQTSGLQPTDALHHLALVVFQDRCNNQGHLEASLTGEGWAQPPLF